MGATTTTDKTNDTGKITAAMAQIGRDIGELEKSLAKMKKLQAAISKKPEECKRAVNDLFDEIGGCVGATNDMAQLPKTLKGAIYT